MEQEQRVEKLVPLPQVDWLVVWKIYHYPYFFWMYAALTLVIKFLTCRHLDSAAPAKTWLLSSTESLLIVPALPLLVVPAFALVRPWQVGVEMLCYMRSHEVRHRAQVCLLAHQLGFPLPKEVAYGMWNWEKLWKECGSPRGPGFDS